jgi:hypothetical protein
MAKNKGVSGLSLPWGLSPIPGPNNPLGNWMNNSAQQISNQQQLAQIANRKVTGKMYLTNSANWTTWTPSGANKVYQETLPITLPLTDNTYFTLTESQGIIQLTYKSSYFEAYSAQKFCVVMTTFVVDKDNAQASSEAAWTSGDPKDYILSHHTDVQRMSVSKVVPARVIGASLWYVKIDMGSMLNRSVKHYLTQYGNFRAVAKLPFEPQQGYMEIQIIAGNTSDVIYRSRLSMRAIMADADIP